MLRGSNGFCHCHRRRLRTSWSRAASRLVRSRSIQRYPD